MNDELSYAEMLEIPVETVTVRTREKKKKKEDLSDRLVSEVNDRIDASDPAYAESKTIEREYGARSSSKAKWVLIGEFAAVVLLVATIFLTNLFVADSAINTFVRGLFRGNASAADARTYAEFTLSPVVNEYAEAEVTVGETGVMSFTAACSVYPPCAGEIDSVGGTAETGYSLRIKHSDSFSTIMSGLDEVFVSVGDAVRANIPVAYSDGEGEVRVMFYDNETLLNCYTVGEGGIVWS